MRKYSSPRNKDQGQADRDQIFQQGDEDIFDLQRGDQPPTNFVTGKGSDDCADCAENRADD